MDLRTEILLEHSKKQAIKIAGWIGNDEKRFTLLLQLFLRDEYRVVQRAAWILSIVADRHPKLLTSHLASIVKRMDEENLPTAVKRNVVRLLQYVVIPKRLQGAVMNSCFRFLSDPKETIAVRCFSMSVLANLSNDYPEIKQELKIVIEEVLKQKASAGVKARSKKVLKELAKAGS
jgi:hypothetical protein